MPTASTCQTTLQFCGRLAIAELRSFMKCDLPIAYVADAVECRMLSAPTPISRVHLFRARMPLQDLLAFHRRAAVLRKLPSVRRNVEADLRVRVVVLFPVQHSYVARNVTTVAPAPPSSGSAVAKSSTSGWSCKYSCTARRKAPVPLPCTRRARLRPAA